MSNPPRVGALVRSRREALGIRTQLALANLVDVDRSHIAKIESGAIALPQLELRRRLGEVLGLSDRDFLIASGFLEEEPADYGIDDTPAEQNLVKVMRDLPPEDRALLVEFADLLARRHRGRPAL